MDAAHQARKTAELAVLQERRRILQSRLTDSMEPRKESAAKRRRLVQGVGRDIAVQAAGTIAGGSVLAGLGVLAGLLPRDPAVIAVALIMLLGLMSAFGVGVSSTTRPSITRSDVQLSGALEALDLLIEQVEAERRGEPEEGAKRERQP